MKVVEKRKKDNKVILEAVASADDVEKAFEAAHISFAQQMGLKPEGSKTISEVAKEKLGVDDVDHVVAPQVVDYLTPFAVDMRNLVPAYPAKVLEKGSAARGRELPFTLEVVLKTASDISSYDPVTITIPPFIIEEEFIEAQIAEMADSYADFVQIDPRPARWGDGCLINLHTSRAGTEVPDLTTENAIYTLGSNLISEEFDPFLVGMNADDTKVFSITYPDESYPPDEQDVECAVTVLEVREKIVPTIDDAWIKENISASETLASFKAKMSEEFDKRYGEEYEAMKRQLAVAELAKRYEDDIEDEALVAMQQTIVNNLQSQLQEEGKNLDAYIKEHGGEKQFNLMTMMQSKDNLAQGYALDAVFRHEGLSINDEDILEACKSFDRENPELARKQMEYAGCGFMIRETAERMKATKWVLKHAKIIEDASASLTN